VTTYSIKHFAQNAVASRVNALDCKIYRREKSQIRFNWSAGQEHET